MATGQLLGEDGSGYELAQRLEGCGAWRPWLGESGYASFANSLASPAAWEAFMRCDPKPTRVQIHLQLRVRALLYDKASASLFFRGSSSSASLANLNPTYLQLHGDDVYFPLEDERHDGIPHDGSGLLYSTSKAQPRPAIGLCKLNEHGYQRASNVSSRYNEPETANMAQRPRNDELSESWYNQCIDKYKINRQLRFPYGDRELHKRTPEAMSTYLKLLEIHKRRRLAFKDDNYTGTANSVWESGSCINSNAASDMNYNSLVDDETCFFPEIMFPWNCVPDSALPSMNQLKENQNVDVYGVLDNIPHIICRSPAMIERFGIRPEYLRMGLGRSKNRGKTGPEGSQKLLTQEQASKMSQKVIARVLANVGIEGGTEVSVEVLSQILSNHIYKLGCRLKLLTDSYRKQFSSIELLKMFLQTAGFSNLGNLADLLKDSNKVFSHQTLQHGRTLQDQNHLLQAQQQQQMQRQMQRQMQPQMNPLHSQTLAFQQQQQLLLQGQQWDKMRQRHAATPGGPGMTLEKDRPLVEVKIENTVESPMDGTFNTLNKQQMQFRNQQMAMPNHLAQSGHQFKQIASVQVPPHQPQSPFSIRTPPVKVEGFQELVGGDASVSHESDERKLTSPAK